MQVILVCFRMLQFCIFKASCFVCFKQEEQNRGKPNWEHLNEELHVLITVEDTVNRAEVKMAKAMEEVKKLLVPAVSMADNGIPTLRSFISKKHKNG